MHSAAWKGAGMLLSRLAAKGHSRNVVSSLKLQLDSIPEKHEAMPYHAAQHRPSSIFIMAIFILSRRQSRSRYPS